MPYKNVEDRRRCQREWYQRNLTSERARLSVRRDAQREANQALMRSLKSETSCKDCGLYYPHYVMDFDHITDDKINDVSVMAVQGVSKTKLLAEIDKCEIVCSNCHRKRTWERAH